MEFLYRRILIAVLAIVSHPWTTLAVVLVTAAACGGAAIAWLTVSTDQNQLFSSKPWFFHDYLQFISRFRENEAVYVVIEPRDFASTPPIARWTAAADRVTERLRGLPQVIDAYCRIPLDQLGKQAILFEDPGKLPQRFAAAQGLGQLAAIWGAKPTPITSALGRNPIDRSLAGAALKPDEQTANFIAHLADSWDQAIHQPGKKLSVGDGVADFRAISAANPSELGYFYVPDVTDRSRHRILVQVFPQREFASLTSVTRTIDAIRDAAIDAGKDFPEFQIGITGRPALEAEEMRTTNRDTHHAEIIALIAVFIGMVVMWRSIWLALAAEIALGVGIAWTFGWATATIGQLNLLSLVFLIALIGIGMDYLVQILSRYRLEARRYERADAVWVRVFKHVGPPINTACLGAAGAFFVAVFTDFQGAAELGIIAGGGLLLCLLAGYVVLPALLTLFPPKLRPLDVSKRYKPMRKTGARWLALPAVWGALLLAGTRYMPLVDFDPDLIKLQVPNLPSVKLVRTLQTWFSVALSKDIDQLRRVRAAVAGLPVVASTDSLLNAQDNAAWLRQHAAEVPSIDWTAPTPVQATDLSAISQKSRDLARVFERSNSGAARTLGQFADDLDHLSGDGAKLAAAQLSDWQRIFVAEVRELIDGFQPGSPDLAAVPRQMRNHYVSDDGEYALYIYPAKDLWNDANLHEFVNTVETAVAKTSGAPHVTGIATDVYHTVDAVHRAFFQSTIYALVLIFALVLLDFRRLAPTLAAISVLAMGLPMLVALMGLFGASWNFANFFGLPILIGAGHEYGVFLVHRYLEAKNHPRRAWRRWDVSDRALLLCAYITSTSFGFFWLLAQHRGLKSLGLVMALGIACIYLAALTVLRPLLKWRLQREAKNLQVPVAGRVG
ncbi:MAG: MMPL family transporter [Tepidisphaeraceae bacterium]|jgi:predicted RND superfamily exporter protein